jgi:hypothetical protein
MREGSLPRSARRERPLHHLVAVHHHHTGFDGFEHGFHQAAALVDLEVLR